jgi:hypothetical protein
MGTYGTKTFENDCALDWISELMEDKNLAMVAAKLYEVNNEYNERPDELLDSDLASEALAAAEIVAALLEAPSNELPTNVNKWLKKKSITYDNGLISMFSDIIKNIDFDDDFKSRWEDYSKEDKWKFALTCMSRIAVNSIDIVLENSELKELWIEGREYEKWVDEVNNLKCKILKKESSL